MHAFPRTTLITPQHDQQVKGRPLTDPLIAHVAEPSQAWAVFQCGGENQGGVENTVKEEGGEDFQRGSDERAVAALQGRERRLLGVLAQQFWPGPLTLVAPAAAAIPAAVTAETVGGGDREAETCVRRMGGGELGRVVYHCTILVWMVIWARRWESS